MLHQRMFESGTYKSLPEHIALYKALEASMARAQRDEFLAEKNKLRKPAWLKSILEDDIPATLEPAWVIPTSHVPNTENNWANALAATYQALAENSLLENTGDMWTFMNWYCQKMGKTELTQEDLEDQIDWTNLEGNQVRIDINRPLPLSGPPGHMKVARYHDFGLELLVPEHMWIDDVCTYDISASYGISHWWFNRQKFYIVRHTSKSSHKIVRTHMRILSVVIKKAYSRYGYDNLKEITLRRANHQEYTFAEKDFKNLYPNDFEDLNLLLLQGHLNHLPGSDIRMLSTAVKLWTQNLVIRQRVEDFQLGIESYQNQLNLTKPRWDATGFEFKHDYTIIDSPRAVVFPVSNNEQKIMRFNEIYKFSDGMLTNIIKALDYRVKEYKVNRLNPDSRPEESSGIWKALLVDEFAILTTDFFREWNDLFIPLISQNRRDLPRDNPLVSVEVLRNVEEKKGEAKENPSQAALRQSTGVLSTSAVRENHNNDC
ncbi:hypothetical protein Tco_0893462 [Tanacetum coccineum]|uniref:Angiotensin-converting enzyme n=1 Tax=Tanacetum coccineum TaxID=301880 RepID=A0ABQ5C9E6_9ASTR